MIIVKRNWIIFFLFVLQANKGMTQEIEFNDTFKVYYGVHNLMKLRNIPSEDVVLTATSGKIVIDYFNKELKLLQFSYLPLDSTQRLNEILVWYKGKTIRKLEFPVERFLPDRLYLWICAFFKNYGHSMVRCAPRDRLDKIQVSYWRQSELDSSRMAVMEFEKFFIIKNKPTTTTFIKGNYFTPHDDSIYYYSMTPRDTLVIRNLKVLLPDNTIRTVKEQKLYFIQ